MKCVECGVRIKQPKGKTRDTQTCGQCRGWKSSTFGNSRYNRSLKYRELLNNE